MPGLLCIMLQKEVLNRQLSCLFPMEVSRLSQQTMLSYGSRLGNKWIKINTVYSKINDLSKCFDDE